MINKSSLRRGLGISSPSGARRTAQTEVKLSTNQRRDVQVGETSGRVSRSLPRPGVPSRTFNVTIEDGNGRLFARIKNLIILVKGRNLPDHADLSEAWATEVN